MYMDVNQGMFNLLKRKAIPTHQHIKFLYIFVMGKS